MIHDKINHSELYKLLKSLDELIGDWTYDEPEMEKALLHCHDHVCWLNPTETLHSPRTRRMCKKFCKRNGVPRNPDYPKEYDCDNCPNMIIRYQYKNDFIAAFGNSYLYKKEGKME